MDGRTALTSNVPSISLDRRDVLLSRMNRVSNQCRRNIDDILCDCSSLGVVAADQLESAILGQIRVLDCVDHTPTQREGVCNARVQPLASIDGVNMSCVTSEQDAALALFCDERRGNSLLHCDAVRAVWYLGKQQWRGKDIYYSPSKVLNHSVFLNSTLCGAMWALMLSWDLSSVISPPGSST